jgi:hypothetical protein
MDIVLDTNAFRIFIDNDTDEFINAITEKCDHVYVHQDINKELRGLFYGSLNLMYTYLRRFGVLNKFHKVSVIENVQLPDRIEEELRKYNASSFDLKVAKLCFAMCMKGNKVHLVSNDSSFLNTRNLLEKYDIYVKPIEEFKGEYLSPSV